MSIRALQSVLLLMLAGTAALWIAAVERRDEDARVPVGGPAETVAASLLGEATWSAAGETAGIWYCPAGTAGGRADHVVTVGNTGDTTVTGTLTLFSEVAGDDEAPERLSDRTHPIEVGPDERLRVRLADLYDGNEGVFLAALVETDVAHGPEVRVAHEVSGGHGTATGSCATRGASEWHFAWGATTRDAEDLLVLFNPFPNDVVVDAEFSTPGGIREPLRWQGLTVPARRVVAVDVGDDVTRRAQVAASLRARSGALVVERLQVFDGSLDVEGMRLSMGRTAPALHQILPGGDRREMVVLYNPTDESAELEVHVVPDAPDEPPPLPFGIVLRPGQSETLDYSTEGRVPSGSSYETQVRSLNAVPVVAEQVLLDGKMSAAP